MRRISHTTGWYYTRLARARKSLFVKRTGCFTLVARVRRSAPRRFRSPASPPGLLALARAALGGPPAGRAPGPRARLAASPARPARRGGSPAPARRRRRALARFSSDTGFPPTGFPTRRRRRARHRSRACPGARRASARRATPARRRARGGRFRKPRAGVPVRTRRRPPPPPRPRGASRFDRLRLRSSRFRKAFHKSRLSEASSSRRRVVACPESRSPSITNASNVSRASRASVVVPTLAPASSRSGRSLSARRASASDASASALGRERRALAHEPLGLQRAPRVRRGGGDAPPRRQRGSRESRPSRATQLVKRQIARRARRL